MSPSHEDPEQEFAVLRLTTRPAPPLNIHNESWGLRYSVIFWLSSDPLGKVEKGDAPTRGLMSHSHEDPELGVEVLSHFLAK